MGFSEYPGEGLVPGCNQAGFLHIGGNPAIGMPQHTNIDAPVPVAIGAGTLRIDDQVIFPLTVRPGGNGFRVDSPGDKIIGHLVSTPF